MAHAPGVDDLVAYSDAVLERERRSLIERVAQLERRVETHRVVLEQLELQLVADQRLLREVEELTDRRPQMRIERLDRELRGQRLREVAVDILWRRRALPRVVLARARRRLGDPRPRPPQHLPHRGRPYR